MTIPKSIQGDYHHWHNFLDAEVKFSLADSEKHTKEHCARVLLFALLIAVKMDLPHEEREVLCAAAVFHDSRRQDDWLDVGHGQRAADYYREYCRTHPLVFDERAYLVMAFHDRTMPWVRRRWRSRKMAFCCIVSSRTLTPWTAFAWDRVGLMPAICAQRKRNPFINMQDKCSNRKTPCRLATLVNREV